MYKCRVGPTRGDGPEEEAFLYLKKVKEQFFFFFMDI